MAGETVITVVGNLTADPELRYTSNGTPLASFTVASTPRTFDRQTNSWKDGEALFLRCTVWREYAENVAQSLKKGYRVIVRGNLRQHSYETKEREKRTSYELDVDEVGPALRYATVDVQRTPMRGGAGAPGGEADDAQVWSRGAGSSDDWANPAQSFDGDEPPF